MIHCGAWQEIILSFEIGAFPPVLAWTRQAA
jgi:hypothetical protein